MTVVALKPHADKLLWSSEPGVIKAQFGQLNVEARADGSFFLSNAHLSLHISAHGQFTLKAQQISEFSKETHCIRAEQIHLN